MRILKRKLPPGSFEAVGARVIVVPSRSTNEPVGHIVVVLPWPSDNQWTGMVCATSCTCIGYRTHGHCWAIRAVLGSIAG